MAVKASGHSRTQQRMLVQRMIDARMNDIVERIQKLVDGTHIAESRMEKNQIGNILATALDTRSGEVLKNFIRYQIGRDFAANSWQHENFGELLVAEIDRLRDNAQEIIEVVEETFKLNKGTLEAEAGNIWIDLARQYVGQLNRYFYYRKEQAR